MRRQRRFADLSYRYEEEWCIILEERWRAELEAMDMPPVARTAIFDQRRARAFCGPVRYERKRWRRPSLMEGLRQLAAVQQRIGPSLYVQPNPFGNPYGID